MHYISSALLREVQNGKVPRLVIPIVFYHGEEPWEYKSIAQHFGHLSEDLLRYLPRFEYIFHNLQENPDKQILKAFRNQLLISALLTLKHSFDEAYLESRAVFLLESAVDEDGNYFRALFVYLFNRLKKEKTMTKVLEKLSTEAQAEAMSVLDWYEKRGMERGMEANRYIACRNMILKGFDNGIICELLEVDASFVNEVRANIAQDE